jgi:hypothetical protein
MKVSLMRPEQQYALAECSHRVFVTLLAGMAWQVV